MKIDLPKEVKRDVESLARSVAKHEMAATIEIIEKPSGKDDGHGDHGLAENLQSLLASWSDTGHQYYKDVKDLIGDEEDEEDEEDYEEEEEYEDEDGE